MKRPKKISEALNLMPSTMNLEQKKEVFKEAHNSTSNGLKLRKGRNKGWSDTPLFDLSKNQTDLFK